MAREAARGWTRVLPWRRKIFFGWWVALGGALGQALNGAFYFYGFGAFFNPLIAEFGWSRAETSLAFSLSRLEGGLIAPLSGMVIDRFGPRKLMLVGLALMALGYFLFSRVDSLLMFYVVFVLCLSVGQTLSNWQPISTTVGNWFNRKRGTAVGIVMAGFGLGGLGVPVLAWMIQSFGWRNAAVYTGVALLVLSLPVVAVMRHRPEQYGYLPDGDTPAQRDLASAAKQAGECRSEATIAEPAFTPRQALATSAFWILAGVFTMRVMITNAVAVHQIPFLVDVGFPYETAALLFGGLAATSSVGRFGLGVLSDRVDKRHVMAICLSLLAIAMVIMAMTTGELWQVLLYIAIYSLGYGGMTTMTTTMICEYFGRSHLATIQGLFSMVWMSGTMAGPYIAGYVFDVTHSYRLAFLFFAAASVVALAGLLAVKPPKWQPVARPA